MPFETLKPVIVVLTYVLVTVPAGMAVARICSLLPPPKADSTNDTGLNNAGMLVGIFERNYSHSGTCRAMDRYRLCAHG